MQNTNHYSRNIILILLLTLLLQLPLHQTLIRQWSDENLRMQLKSIKKKLKVVLVGGFKVQLDKTEKLNQLILKWIKKIGVTVKAAIISRGLEFGMTNPDSRMSDFSKIHIGCNKIPKNPEHEKNAGETNEISQNK